MKNKFLLVCSLLTAGTMLAQSNFHQKVKYQETDKQLTVAGEATHYEGITHDQLKDELGPTLFEETFSAGVGSWTNSSLNSGAAVWEYRGTSTTPDLNTGSQGAYAGTSGPIESATASDGFMIFDSDYYDNGGTAGNFGGGSMPDPHAGAMTSPTFDCTGENGVVLTFYSYFRQYDAHGYVIVSNDGFTTADTVYDASEFHDVNTAGPVDEYIKVDISSMAANSSTAQVRFLFLSQGNTSPSGYYYWMIDDVTVSGAADFDVGITETFFRGTDTSMVETFYYINYYNQITSKQSGAAPLTFGAEILNSSDATMSNVVLSADVSGDGSFSGTSNANTYTTFAGVDYVDVTTTYTATDVGNYVVDFSVEGDSVDDFPSDNMETKEFNVTERTYAWDEGVVDGGISWSSGTHSMYSRFDFFTNDTVSAVEFAIWSSSTFASDDGSVVLAGIWPVINGTLGGDGEVDFTNPVAAEFIEMSTADFSDGSSTNLIRAAFPEPVAIAAGEYVAGYTYQSGTIRTATSVLETTPLNAFVDSDSDGTIDGWADAVPIIHIETWSQDICANTNITIDGTISCNPADWTATIDAFATGGAGDYTWTWNNGATTEDITVDAEGDYTATVVDENFCDATHTFTVDNASIACNLSVGNLNSDNFSFNVLPNPNNGIFTIAFSSQKAESVTMEIHSIKGTIVAQDAFTVNDGTTNRVDLSGLSSGVYMIKVTGESGTSIERMIIE